MNLVWIRKNSDFYSISEARPQIPHGNSDFLSTKVIFSAKDQ